MISTTLTIRQAFEEHYHKDELGSQSHRPFMAAFRAWEKLTNNPDISAITNATVEAFRRDAIELGLAPITVNKYWTFIRSVLRRIGPVTDKNPWALDLFPGWRVPAMRPCKVDFKRPRRLSMEELSRLYIAARHMRRPIRDISVSAFWWQALLVIAYNTGLRSGDLLKIRWQDIDTQRQTLYVKVNKTGVEADLPLHPVTMAHLSRLPRCSEWLFEIDRDYFYTLWRTDLREQSGVRCGLHDIRRTACSEIDRVDRGLGKTLLLHAPRDVTEKSYLNSVDDLRPAIEKMEWPLAFKHGTKMAVRALKKAHQVMLNVDDFAMPVHPPKEAFGFPSGGFTFMGRFYPVKGNYLAIIKTLVDGNGVATQKQLWEASDHRPFPATAELRKRLYIRLLEARKALVKHLMLPDGFNPIVPTSKFKSSELRDYELFLPPAVWQS